MGTFPNSKNGLHATFWFKLDQNSRDATLAGSDSEWFYILVRRFLNMVEESVKKSTELAVFEPNDAPLWTKAEAKIR